MRTALVTGASGGIGSAIARRLARSGHRVAVHYFTGVDRARAVVAAIEAEGGTARAFRADLTSEEEVGALAGALDAWGGLDVLVANAGVTIRQPLLEVTPATFDRVFALNARGTFLTLRACAPRIRRGGAIVATSAGSTVVAPPGSGVYTATKAAVIQYCKALSRELADNDVTVNAVSPGPIDTPLLAPFPGARENGARVSPFGRLGMPDDVAGVVAFLAGPDARWVTGQTLQVSGGGVLP